MKRALCSGRIIQNHELHHRRRARSLQETHRARERERLERMHALHCTDPAAHEHGVRIKRLAGLLKEAMAKDYDLYISLRSQISVFDLIEIAGEWMIDSLCERGTFRREEITLPRQLKSQRERNK